MSAEAAGKRTAAVSIASQVGMLFLLFLKRFGLLWGLWLVLTLGERAAWAPGIAAAALGALLSLHLLPATARQVRWLKVLRLAPGFLAKSLTGGLDVAWRALDPRVPVHPGWIACRVRLPPGPSRVSLGSEISLMPGTLAAGGDGELLYIHCLDRNQPVADIVAAEEQRIAASIGSDLEVRRD